ncbi:MAG: hypothetical protein P8046_14480 [Anaerolineales bacterium]
MLDINLIRENPEVVRAGMQKRGMDPAPVDKAFNLDTRWREVLQEVESLKAERNKVSKEIGKMKDIAEREAKIAAMREVADKIKVLDEEVSKLESDLNAVMSIIPNIPSSILSAG